MINHYYIYGNVVYLYLGTLASNLARGATLSQAVHRAVCCASVSVTRRGAQVSYPLLRELDPSVHPPVAPSDWKTLSLVDQKAQIRNQLSL